MSTAPQATATSEQTSGKQKRVLSAEEIEALKVAKQLLTQSRGELQDLAQFVKDAEVSLAEQSKALMQAVSSIESAASSSSLAPTSSDKR